MLFRSHETASTLTQQTIPAVPSSPGPAPLVANLSVDPPGLPAGAQMAAAEVLLAEGWSTDGPAQAYLYVSNRNVGSALDPRGDAIAIFALEPELALVRHVFTGLQQVRGMQLSGRAGVRGGAAPDAYLAAGGVAGDAGVVVMRRTLGGADLEIVARNADVPTRSSFVWVDSGI